MRSYFRFLHLYVLLILLLPLVISSCINTKKFTYFNNLSDSSKIQLSQLQPPQPLIQVNDILEVRVGGESEKTVEYINSFMGGAGAGLQNTVDIDGNIELPKIGKIKVVDLTRDEAKQLITNAYAEFLKNPIVNVKFGNFRFAVLGEVKAPGYYSVPNEKINVLEAMAQAGDMTQYAKKDKVKIIRDVNGKRELVTLNFNDKNLLNSPDYYLNRYDIIYVQPGKLKFFSENYSRTTAIIASATSLLAILLVIFK